MKNLQKYTKAELISKYNKLQENNNNNNSIFSRLIEYILLFKTFVIKITLIGILIKLFRKYSLLRKIWTALNFLIMSLFGVSLVDLYGFEYLKPILEYIRSTQFYLILSNLLGHEIKEVEVEESPTKLKSINKTSTGSERDSKIIEWFSK